SPDTPSARRPEASSSAPTGDAIQPVAPRSAARRVIRLGAKVVWCRASMEVRHAEHATCRVHEPTFSAAKRDWEGGYRRILMDLFSFCDDVSAGVNRRRSPQSGAGVGRRWSI